MLKQSNQFTNAIKSDVREAKARVTINNIVYDDEIIKNIEFSGSALSGEQFSIGSTHENTIKIEFTEVIETLTALDKVYVEVGFKREEFDEPLKAKTNVQLGKTRMGTRLNLWNSTEDVEYSLLGEFYITEHVDINYNDNITTISGKDQMVFMEGDYESALEYPTDIRNVIVEIANSSGVQIDTLNIENLEGIQVGKIEGYSHRQAMGFLAQLLVGYVYFNRKGLLQIKRLSNAEYDITPEEYFSKGLTKNGIRYRVGGISCNVPHEENPQELFVGSRLGPQIAIENPLMTQDLLQDVYDKLKEVDYYPFDLDWRGNPAIEVGDLVTVYDVEGNELKVPNLNYGLTYNGGLTAKSSADTKSRTDIVASGRKTLQQQINTTQQRIKETSDNLMDAFKDAQEKITGNQGGFIIQRMNEDGKPYEFLVMDTEDINSASNVIRLNQQGIGFSQNGYNGPFGVAITIDGQIVADYITAGTLSAELIQSGFNKVAAGTSITQEGIKQVANNGEYAIIANGGMQFYTAADDFNGSIESSYTSVDGQSTGVSGVGIFIQPRSKFNLVRSNPESANTPILDVPENVDEVRLRRPLNAYGNEIYDALSFKTRNDIHESVFRTWSSGEAFIGGATGARIGYYEEGTMQAVINVPRTGDVAFNRALDLRNYYLRGVGVLEWGGGNVTYRSATPDSHTGHRALVISAEGTLNLGINNETNIRTFRYSSGVKGTQFLTDVDMNGYYLSNVREYNNTNSNGHLFNVGGNRKLDILSDGLVMHSRIDMNSYGIINQSDIRLKKDIKPAEVIALKEIDRLEYIDYWWDKDKKPNAPDGQQFGIKAQYAPFLQTKAGGEDSYLSIDYIKYIDLVGKGVQESYAIIKQLIKRIEALEDI